LDVWTGTDENGDMDTVISHLNTSCQNWTTLGGANQGEEEYGTVGRAGFADTRWTHGPVLIGPTLTATTCGTGDNIPNPPRLLRMYCFEQ
jgi:hypothetical protein